MGMKPRPKDPRRVAAGRKAAAKRKAQACKIHCDAEQPDDGYDRAFLDAVSDFCRERFGTDNKKAAAHLFGVVLSLAPSTAHAMSLFFDIAGGMSDCTVRAVPVPVRSDTQNNGENLPN